MKLIVGLGNPGNEYQKTRHNVGFMFVDAIASMENRNYKSEISKNLKSEIIKTKDIIFARPQTFMNSSGLAIKKLVNFYKVNLSNLIVVHDDLDLKLGEYKLQFGVGPKVHNGVISIEDSLQSKDFWRMRIGIDNRDPLNRIPGEAYVLQSFNDEEIKTLLNSFIDIWQMISQN